MTFPLINLMRAAFSAFGLFLFLAILGWGCLPGCNKAPPPITKQTFTIPTVIVKQQEEKAAVDKNLELAIKRFEELSQQGPTEATRMLAVIVPQPNTDYFWTFKVQGKPAEMETLKPELMKLLGSLRWKSTDPVLPEWDLPEGWQVDKQTEDRFGRMATITLPGEAAPPKIAVAKFTNTGDWPQALLTNLNRWRGQLKLEPVSLEAVNSAFEKVPFSGGEALLMDKTGIAMAMPGMTPPPAAKEPSAATTPAPTETKQPPAANEPSKLLDYTAPEKWVAKRGSSIRIATFAVTEGDESAEVAVTQFPKVAQMTDPLANVNRWRGELGLKPATAAELPEQTTSFKLGDDEATIFTGTGTFRDKPAATLAAMIVRPERVWFVKMQGDARLVSQQRETFEAFLKSLKFKE